MKLLAARTVARVDMRDGIAIDLYEISLLETYRKAVADGLEPLYSRYRATRHAVQQVLLILSDPA
jgi:hypothetical protein